MDTVIKDPRLTGRRAAKNLLSPSGKMPPATTPDPFPYQASGIDWLCQPRPNAGPYNLHALLADDPGLGKTLQAVRAADRLGAQSMLVLCQGIGRDTWQREVEYWQQTPRTTTILRGWAKQDLADVTICAYPTLQSLPVLSAILARNWDIVICDEAQALKDPKSLTTQIVYGDRLDCRQGVASKASAVWLLSGTPCPNGPHELWTHGMALFPSAVRDLTHYEMWRNKFCVQRKSDYGKQILGFQNETDLFERWYPYIRRRSQEQVLKDLPELRWGHVVVRPDKVPPLPEEAREAEMIVKAALASLEKHPDANQVQSILNANSMHIATLLKWTGIAKAHAVADAVNEDFASGVQKLVLFAHHKEVFATLEKKISGSVSITGETTPQKRQYYIDAFQGRVADFNPRCLMCSLSIAATTLTLTAAHHVGVVESRWVPDVILQAVKRLHRIGQKNKVLARLYSLAGSVDEAVHDVIMRKYLMTTKIKSAFERIEV
jgi:SNF2 family DNA or RNA helicase